MVNGSWVSMMICVGVLALLVLRVPVSPDPAEMHGNLRRSLPAVFFRPASSTLFGEDQDR